MRMSSDSAGKTTKRARRKASRSKDDDTDSVQDCSVSVRYCVASCKHNGNGDGDTVQCHFCQVWVHHACVGVSEREVVGIWKCKSCRILPSLAERLLEKSTSLEDLVRKLETSNEQLVSFVIEQRQEMRSMRDDATAFSKRPYAEVARSKPSR